MPYTKNVVKIQQLENKQTCSLKITNADKDVKQQKLSFIPGMNAKGYGEFRRKFSYFLQVKCHFAIKSSNPTDCY